MTWPLPAPQDLADRAASVFETATNPDGSLAFPGIDARSPNTVAAVLCRLLGITGYDAYLYQQYCSVELFPDTAVDHLPEHLAIWGITQDPPVAAQAQVLLLGQQGTPIPTGAQLTAPSLAVYTVTTGVTLGASGGVATVTAAVAGAAGTLAAGTKLTLVSPIGGLAPQSGVVQSAGLLPGEDQESLESARQRMLQRIRTPGAGGSAADYQTWARASNPAVRFVQVAPLYAGRGTVAVYIAMSGPRAPTTAELAAVTSYIEGLRPVAAAAGLAVLPAILAPVAVTVALSPDSVQVQGGALAALSTFFGTDAELLGPWSISSAATGQPPANGGTLSVSRLDNALSSQDGETFHERSAPAADVTAPVGTLLTLGAVTLQAA